MNIAEHPRDWPRRRHGRGTSRRPSASPCSVILVWAATGPLFHFTDTWQLVINTGTTIVTFLMVFLIQNTQNRDTRAMQLKLDELLRAVRGAHTALADLEDMTEEELEQFKARYVKLAEEAKAKLEDAAEDLVDVVDQTRTAN